VLFRFAFDGSTNNVKEFALALAPAKDCLIAQAAFVSVHLDLPDALKCFLVNGLAIVALSQNVAQRYLGVTV
jgi:hypothetical protein